MTDTLTHLHPEQQRLQASDDRQDNWKRWGPYLSERQWGTVREDYSPHGSCWDYFPHEHARQRTYRWGEDGLLGLTDRQCRLCFGVALWNGQDNILKERLYGLTGPEGNHGEDVKELYYYLDATPTYAYSKALYKYPQRAFPYAKLLEENKRRSVQDPEFEITDTGVFDEDRYFDVVAEYAKASPNDIYIRLTITNQGPDAAPVHLLPTFWFRNTWVWGSRHEASHRRPTISQTDPHTVLSQHETLGDFRIDYDPNTTPTTLFTENETNTNALFGIQQYTPYVKDAFHRYVVNGETDAINPKAHGTKHATHHQWHLASGESKQIQIRLCDASLERLADFNNDINACFDQRQTEANSFYALTIPDHLDDDQTEISRQAYAGLLWSKQFYHYVIEDWIAGDANGPTPPKERLTGRNAEWSHLYCRDILSMPDKWEYPWFAAWDLAFHMIPFAKIDPTFAKRQLNLLLREWYMHPNGQIPAYEFQFSDVNPPVHAWACWRIYKMTGERGKRDRTFLARTFQKLLVNFTWWVNRKDPFGKHLFTGGFLGLDNIGVFDRSQPLPGDAQLVQADGTAWMAFYCSTMLSMALELAEDDWAYEDMASKFFEHFIAITDAMNNLGETGLWDEQDGFYYDQLHTPDDIQQMKIRSMVGIIPLFAVECITEKQLAALPGFHKRTKWFLRHRPDLAKHITYLEHDRNTDAAGTHMLAMPSREHLKRALRYILDPDEFLSPYGIRSLSKVHAEHPFRFESEKQVHQIDYTPGESTTQMFGGNSNWRGPIWLPLNYLLIESLEKYHHFYQDDFLVECPVGSGQMMNLGQVAQEIARRLCCLFEKAPNGQRPCLGDDDLLQHYNTTQQSHLFHEYFHADTGKGLGASHQTGWTALITRCFEQRAQP